jgi:phosphoribosylamine--glycine ligase
MKILVISKGADSAGLWHTLKSEGHDIFVFIKESWARDVAQNMIDHVSSVEEGVSRKPDFIVFDMSGMGGQADELRKRGFKVIGASALADKLEHDRSYGVSVAKQFGVEVPATVEFKTVDEAIQHVKKTKKAYAIKVDGQNVGEASSYVSKSAEDMLDYLSYAKEEGRINGDTFVLQDVVAGSEVSTEGWFSNGQLVPGSVNSTWETKKLMAGELGPRTGCETSVVCHYEGDSRLFAGTVSKILPLLKHAKWTGPIDINAIVSEENKKPYFLEFTPRFGYSAIYAYAAILGCGLGEFFSGIANGSFRVPYKATWGTTLKLSVPPYPVDIQDKVASKETYGASAGLRVKGIPNKNFSMIDIMTKKNRIVTAGTSGIVGECLGVGRSFFDAWRQSQQTFEKIDVPNKQGRLTDGVEDAWKRIKKLQSWGYSDIPKLSAAGTVPSTPVGATTAAE